MLQSKQTLEAQYVGRTPLKEALIACKIMIKYVLIFGCIVNVLALASPLYSMQVLDRVLSSSNLNTLAMLTIVMIVVLSLLGLIQGARSFAMNRMSTWFENKLSESVFKNSIYSALESRTMANSQQMRDLQTVKTYLTSPTLTTVLDLPWAIIFLIVLFMLHPAIGFLTVIGGVVLIGVGLVADFSTKKLIEQNNEDFIRSMRYVEQATRNAETIKVMGFMKNIINSWQRVNEKVQEAQSLSVERQAVFAEIIKFIRALIQIAVTCCGAYLVVTTQGATEGSVFSAGKIIAASSLVARALAPFEIAITSWKGYVNAKKAYDRLNAAFLKVINEEELMQLPDPEGSLSIENIYYGIIKNVSFSLDQSVLGVVGHSGSGKTTLVRLVVGAINPSYGVIRVDGSSIKDWRAGDLGKKIGYLAQSVELFNGTIRENIARMDTNPNDEDIIYAAQLAGVHELISRMPQGYNTNIGIDGSMLSGGERQRIGLARAIYGNPRILVLDEPNSNLDAAGEEALNLLLDYAKEVKMTVIIVTHKQSVLQKAEMLLVMHAGTMVAFGPRDEVLKKMSSKQVTT